MTMKVPKGSTFIQNAVGFDIYVWSLLKGKPSHSHCVITAHGRTAGTAPQKPNRDVELRFYCEHGFTQGGATDIRKLASGYCVPRETTSAQKLAYDYTLSKYQGKHQSSTSDDEHGETYAYIAKHIHNLEEFYRDVCKVNAETARKFLAEHRGHVNMDVITIRNRKFKSPPTLTEVLNALDLAGYKYDVVHCSFCRPPEKGSGVGQQEPIIAENSIFS